MKRIFFVATLTVIQTMLFAQFNQFNATNMLYNPAFAGSTLEGKLNIDNIGYFRDNEFSHQYYVGYDQYINKLKGGFGFYITGYESIDKDDPYYGKSLDYGINASIIYSKKFKIGEKFSISPAIKISLSEERVSLDTFMYYNIVQYRSQRFRSSASMGILLNSQKFYFGISLEEHSLISVINEKGYDYNTGVSRDSSYSYYPSTFYPDFLFQSGYVFKFKNDNFSLTPIVRAWLRYYVDYKRLDYGFNQISTSFRYKQTELGGGYSNGGLLGMLGYNFKNGIRMGYSMLYFGGRYVTQKYIYHELSVRYLIK